ncbi:uncharacterized protein LOC142632211 [Castanea sativa]|uniref:uncharacterized protein LOC142632211 n=1 Tax=Castanea sativa TaxID=21020 RepID=UPI003F654299
MVKMDFSEHWIKLLMLCVKTVSYSILINRSKTTIFFNKATCEETKNHIKTALGVPEIVQYERVFKLRFFPDCSILEATNSTSGSHAWRSILKGRDVLLQGARWRVGSGESISVWNDAWLLSLDHPKILSQVVPGFEDAKVSNLINPISRRWEVDLIRGLFPPEEAEVILSIPLSNLPMKDKCPKIAEVWDDIQGFEFRQLLNFQSFKDLVAFVHTKVKNLELMAMVMWTVWHRRNQIKVSSQDFPASQVLPQAKQALTDFKHLNASLPPQQDASGNPLARTHWSPPPRDCFKVNFDGASFSDLGKAGLGVVIRDCNGRVVASLLE